MVHYTCAHAHINIIHFFRFPVHVHHFLERGCIWPRRQDCHNWPLTCYTMYTQCSSLSLERLSHCWSLYCSPITMTLKVWRSITQPFLVQVTRATWSQQYCAQDNSPVVWKKAFIHSCDSCKTRGGGVVWSDRSITQNTNLLSSIIRSNLILSNIFCFSWLLYWCSQRRERVSVWEKKKWVKYILYILLT